MSLRIRFRHLAVVAVAATVFTGCSTDPAPISAPSSTQAGSDDVVPVAAETGDTSADVSVGSSETELGEVLVDSDGLSLYGFTPDADGVPTCVDACAQAWPPVTVPTAELPGGFDAAVFSVVQRPDGTFQLRAGVWPLYRFAGDAAPGEINGQGSGGNWFLAAPDGSLIRPDSAPATDTATDDAATDTGADPAGSGY